jgi:hypothetical protein
MVVPMSDIGTRAASLGLKTPPIEVVGGAADDPPAMNRHAAPRTSVTAPLLTQ